MPPLDPRTDFQDDGGTRAWRANHATYGRIIDVREPGLRGWYRRSSPAKIFVTIVVGGFICLGLFIEASVLFLLLWDHFTRR